MKIEEISGYDLDGSIDEAIKILEEAKAKALDKIKSKGHSLDEWEVMLELELDYSYCFYASDEASPIISVTAVRKGKNK